MQIAAGVLHRSLHPRFEHLGTWPLSHKESKVNILLVYKWGYDPDDLYVRPDGTYKFVRGKLTASDDDAAAIVCARETVATTGGKLSGVTIGTGDASWALARAAGETTTVEDYTYSFDDSLTARRIASAIKSAEKADLIVMGDDSRFAGVQGYVAAKLKIPLVAGLEDFEACPDDSACILAHRKTPRGTETLKIHTPALVTVIASESETQAPTMKQTLAARKLPVNKVDGASLDPIEDSKAAVVATRTPEMRLARILEGTPAEAADALVAALKADQIL